ncbi:GGDEF domain-containing protein [Jeongeupia chitinilytica]|uniref:diguanylate cyclase n=1 Tax=Jeongeupia chitinilytica TaxID=1041641 RepID=A0ABQ3H4K9_9NEIS|nr:diguanylate cyclase [Jeongeupia chitinilytica]GHD67855.1 hypothetical protein GCM10007350_32150 [Jeongeupia chitinilytica]
MPSTAPSPWHAEFVEAQASVSREQADSDLLRAIQGRAGAGHFAQIGLWLGLSLLLESLLPQAIEAWLAALESALSGGQARIAASLWLELATLGREHGDAALALRLDQHAAELARSTEDTALHARSALATAADLYALGDAAGADAALDYALAHPGLAGLQEARPNEQIATLLALAGRAGEARTFCMAAAERYRANGAPLGELRCCLQLAMLDDDPQHRHRAARLATGLAPDRLDRAQHRLLADLFEASGELALAVTHLDAALAPRPPVAHVPSRRISSVAMRLQLLASRIELSQLRDRTTRDSGQDRADGSLSRAALNARLPALIVAANDGVPLGMLQIAVDRFGEIRAQRARHVGDDVLRTVTALLRLDREAGDLLARIGDDEFLLALPGADADAARRAAEAVRRRIAEYDWTALHPALSVSVSVGAVACLPGDSADILLFRADLARYLAQRGGGNCVSNAEGVAA